MISRGMANLDPLGLIGRINVGDHYTLLHTKYISSGPHCFRKEFFKFFPLLVYGSTTPWGMASLDPRGLICKIYVGYH